VNAKPEKKDAEKKADAKPVSASPVNTKCPVSGKDVESGFTATFETKTVGFCCDKCQAKFEKEPKAYADKIVADAAK
jgi:YHS domain-containing protein